MTDKKTIKGAIVFSTRMDLRDALRMSLKKLSVVNIEIVTTVDAALTALQNDEQGLLIIDFELGWDVLTKTLETIKSNHRLETRPIMLFAKEVSARVLALVYEYHVTKVHIGEVSKNKIQELITSIGKEEGLQGPLRTVFTKVRQKREGGDWPGARTILEGLMGKVPDNPKVKTELAENLIHEEKWEEALAVLEPLASLDPPNVRALHLLGRCRMKLGQFKEASVALGKAKLMNPFHVERLVALGQAFLYSDDVAAAKQVFTEAEQLAPKNKEAIKGKGQCLLLEGEVNEALSLFKEISDHRELASVFNTAAIVAMRHGRFTDGLSLYDTAMKVITGDGLVTAKLHFNKGVGYRRWQKDGEALQCFESALKCDGRHEKAKRSYIFLAKKLGMPIPPELLGSQGTSGQERQEPESDLSADPSGQELLELAERLEGSSYRLGKEAGKESFDVDFNDDIEDDEALAYL